jgi:hypothetical protein
MQPVFCNGDDGVPPVPLRQRSLQVDTDVARARRETRQLSRCDTAKKALSTYDPGRVECRGPNRTECLGMNMVSTR